LEFGLIDGHAPDIFTSHPEYRVSCVLVPHWCSAATHQYPVLSEHTAPPHVHCCPRVFSCSPVSNRQLGSAWQVLTSARQNLPVAAVQSTSPHMQSIALATTPICSPHTGPGEHLFR
jgi:hypothetical protein